MKRNTAQPTPTPVEPSPCAACGACPAGSGNLCPRWQDWFAQMWDRVTGRTPLE